MTADNNRNGEPASDRRDQGTVLDRMQMPPMSGDEALRRFHKDREAGGHKSQSDETTELAKLHPVMRFAAVAGTFILIVAALLGVLYLIGSWGRCNLCRVVGPHKNGHRCLRPFCCPKIRPGYSDWQNFSKSCTVAYDFWVPGRVMLSAAYRTAISRAALTSRFSA